MKAIIIASLALSGCMTRPVVRADIPDCERYIPPSLRAPVESADLPTPRNHGDGHPDAQPWREFGIAQTGQLDKANERRAAAEYIYQTCLDEHRKEQVKSTRGFFGRIFG